jgi:hypothetical protein
VSEYSAVSNAAQSMSEILGRLVDARIFIRWGFRPRRRGSRNNLPWKNVFAIRYRRYTGSPASILKVQKHTDEGQYAQENQQHT